MESNALQELWSQYILIERRLKRLELVKKKKTQIQRDYSSYLEPNGKTLLLKEPLTQQEQEGDIYQSIRQENEEWLQLQQPTKILQVNFHDVATKFGTKSEDNLNNNNTQQVKIGLKSKKIGKTTLMKFRFCKLKLFIKKIRRKIQMDKVAQLSNQILSVQTKVVEFNFENQKKSIEIKVFINTDLMLSINNEENHNNDKMEVKMEYLDCKIEETKILNDSCLFKKEQIVVNQRKSPIDFNKNSEKEPPFINRSKKISFKELVQKIELENKQNEKKLSNISKLGQEIKSSEQKLNVYKQIKQEDQDEMIQKEEQQKKENQVIQINEPFYPQNLQEEQAPDKKQGITKQTLCVENTRMDFLKIRKENNPTVIIIDSQDNIFEEQENCQNVDVNRFNIDKIDQTIAVNYQNQDNQDANKIITFQKIQKFLQENYKRVFRERYKLKKQQRSLETQQQNQIVRQKLRELQKQMVLERKRQRQIQRNIKREIELEKQKEKARINENKKQQKLKKKIEKAKRVQQLNQQRNQFCKEHDKKERSRSQNRVLRSQSNQKMIEDNKCQSEQQQQKEETNQNPQQYHPQFAQFQPLNIINYRQQDQLITQFSVPFVQQPYSSFIGNPYFQYQFMPINLIEQQSLSQKSDGQQSINKAQFQYEIGSLLKMDLEHQNPTQFFSFSPQTFLPTPESRKGGNKIE